MVGSKGVKNKSGFEGSLGVLPKGQEDKWKQKEQERAHLEEFGVGSFDIWGPIPTVNMD